MNRLIATIVSFSMGLALAVTVHGQTAVYFSYSAFGEGDVATNTIGNFNPGQSATAYIWVQTEIEIDGVEVVFESDDPGVTFLDSDLPNPDVVLFHGTPDEIVIGPRWDVLGTQLESDFLRFIAFDDIGFGDGILPRNDGSGDFLDLLYDPAAEAFLYGSFEFNVGNEIGTQTLAPSTLIALSTTGVVSAESNELTITVTPIPEPTTGLAFLFSTSIVLLRRKHKR